MSSRLKPKVPRDRRPMSLKGFKLSAVAALALIAALALGTSTAQAADVTIGTGNCANAGGQVTVPAGSSIIIRYRDFENNRGMLEDYLQAQQTMLSLNGGPVIDLSDSYAAPAFAPVLAHQGFWYAEILYPAGTLANAGDSLTWTIVVGVSRTFAEEFNGPVGFSFGETPGPPFITVPGDVYYEATCTVTAA
jgi:hypothetical protein